MATGSTTKTDLTSPAPAGDFFEQNLFERPETRTEPEASSFFAWSEAFMTDHKDLIHDGPNIILQAGMANNGELIKLVGNEAPEAILTVLFDTKPSDGGQFSWRFVYARQATYVERRYQYKMGDKTWWEFDIAAEQAMHIVDVEVTAAGEAIKWMDVNAQGVLKHVQIVADQSIPPLVDDLKGILSDPIVKETVEDVRNDKLAADKALAEFEKQYQGYYSTDKYEHERKSFADRVNNACFGRTGLFHPDASSIIWDEKTKADFLKRMAALRKAKGSPKTPVRKETEPSA